MVKNRSISIDDLVTYNLNRLLAVWVKNALVTVRCKSNFSSPSDANARGVLARKGEEREREEEGGGREGERGCG